MWGARALLGGKMPPPRPLLNAALLYLWYKLLSMVCMSEVHAYIYGIHGVCVCGAR